MKHLIILPIFCLSMALVGQDPVAWTQELKTENDETFVSLTADVQPGWYIYSQNTNPDGPVPTEILVSENENYTTEGEVAEHGDLIKKYDELFEVDVLKYKEQVEFKQKISFKSASDVNVEVTYMVCDSEKCLPPKTIEITIAQ